MKKYINTILGLLIILIFIVVSASLIYFTVKIAWQVTRDINETQKTLFVVILTLLAPIMGNYLTNRQAKLKDFELRNREKKEKAYENFVDLLYQFLRDSNDGGVKNERKRMIELLAARKNLVVWGSDEVVKNYSEFMKYSQNLEGIDQAEATKLIEIAFENLIKAIRKDLGYKNQRFISGDISRYFR